MDRKDFYYGQEVTQAELDAAFDDVENAIKARVSDHNMQGVTTGFLVEQNIPTPDLSVRITGGVAYSRDTEDRIPMVGNTSENLSSHVPSTPGESVYVRIYVKHDLALSDPRLDGLGASIDYVQDDTYEIGVRAGTPAVTPTKPSTNVDEVSLGVVLLTQGQTIIGNSDISMDIWNGDRHQGGIGLVPGDKIKHLVKFDGAEFAAGEAMIDFEDGGIIGLDNITMNGDGSEFIDIDEMTFIDHNSFINMTRGIIRMANSDEYLLGGDLRMQGGRIQRAEYVAAEEASNSTGFLYHDRTDTTNEQGVTVAIPKYIHYQPNNFWPGVTSLQDDPWQPGTPANDTWYLEHSWGSGDPPATPYSTSWRYKLITGGTPGSPLYSNGLHCPINVPSSVKFVNFRLYYEVLAGGMPANVWIVVLLQKRVPGSNTISFIHTALNPQNQGSSGDYNFDTASVETLNDSETIEAVVAIKSEASALPNLRILGGRATVEIFEASWEY